MERRFNVRVYGIWIDNGRLLVNEEQIKDRAVIKFPGGGLDWGESTLDCLKREWQEELGLDVEILQHFYTTDFFQASAYDNSQVISIYYLISGKAPETLTNQMHNERTYWMELKDVSPDTFTLPIDKKVGRLLQEQYATTS
jgi:ADP-ribose pyrophosphatase YjhB (NUDIX family)